MSNGQDTRAVFVTAPSTEVAQTLAQACVNIIPGLTSVYEWEGKVQSDSESLLMIKTSDSKLSKLSEWVVQNHPYDVPEVIALPIQGGSESYINWIKETLKKAPIVKE
ncbi:Uncharacterized protein FKW44_020683 [Caligus rogercresseyi]|uniref:CutA homolog n=1 Tax=Caligus rogercresseyi TaxID=217165 RepID=A0A7T8GQD4_CALRO|nr:Uncharacterized protein FKW44_020683 [Caligus rogercresseyi]